MWQAPCLPHLAPQGVKMVSFVPGYPAVMAALENAQELHRFDDLAGAPAVLRAGKAKGLDVIVLDAQHLFNRAGNPYLGPDGKDWPDNARRFAVFSEVAAELAKGSYGGFSADLLHGHDWQAGLGLLPICAIAAAPSRCSPFTTWPFRASSRPKFLPRSTCRPQAYAVDGVEYYGNVSFLKGGLASADAISTVSPTYAQEICTANYGMGLEGLLQARRASLCWHRQWH